jgi:hypothetical protein
MALLERLAYFFVSRRLDVDGDALLDSVTTLVHRGFFGAPVGYSDDSSSPPLVDR